MPAVSAWESDALSAQVADVGLDKRRTHAVEAWSAFVLAMSCTIASQGLELYVTARLCQEGGYVLASLMIIGLLYSRGNRAYRGIAGYHLQTDKFAGACAEFFRRPAVLLPAFFRIDEIKAQFDVLVLKKSPLKLTSLTLTTILSESVIQMYLKSITLMGYWKRSATFAEYGFVLASVLLCTASTGVGLLQFELVMGNDNGYTCPPAVSTFALCHLATRIAEFTGRCFGVATFVVFFPFPAIAAAVLVTEELLIICFVIIAKAVENPAFLGTMRNGRFGECKRYAYMLVVLWPMYWCMHTQRYIESVPRPAFSYWRYYTLRLGFAWARGLLLVLTLHFHTRMRPEPLATIAFASMAGTAAWMALFPIMRRMATVVNGTKQKKVEPLPIVPEAVQPLQTGTTQFQDSDVESFPPQADKTELVMENLDEEESLPHQPSVHREASIIID
eukprot:TRINITY_DN50395_c0_g1_i1.p1 TRINITY_DN50395_c0_g1~~TRINITY_DN50395_c0_g1_i1.p1  ORF type:complete len:446 (+),score=33.44 TRINITY_DN50395_c0_g1_i1:235-1572(+)